MTYYNITISVEEGSRYQTNFLKLLQCVCENKELLSIKPMKTKIFTSDCLFFDDVDTLTYKEISKIAEIGSGLDLKVESINKVDTFSNEIRNIVDRKSFEIYSEITKLMSGKASTSTTPESITVDIPDSITEEPNEVAEEVPSEPDVSTNEDNSPEETYTEFEDDLDMDDSEPNEEPVDTEPEVPQGKLYDDTYEMLMTYQTFNSKNDSQQADVIHAEVGLHELYGNIETRKYWRLKPHHNFDSYTEKYPEMINVDEPAFWLKSYTNYVRQENIYKNEGNDEDGFYNFDSFIRAKLNRDLISEDKVRIRINKLYE